MTFDFARWECSTSISERIDDENWNIDDANYIKLHTFLQMILLAAHFFKHSFHSISPSACVLM